MIRTIGLLALSALSVVAANRREQAPTAPTITYATPQGVGASLGVGALVAVKDSLNPLGLLEFTLRADTYVMGPAMLRVEMRLPTGSIWREQTLPTILRRGQHVRMSQR